MNPERRGRWSPDTKLLSSHVEVTEGLTARQVAAGSVAARRI